MTNDKPLLDPYFDGILPLVNKPSSYLGQECIIPQQRGKPAFNSTLPSVVLVFPDLYEIAVSHLGLKLLEGNLLRARCCNVDRFYAVGRDMEAFLRSEDMEPQSLDYRRPLSTFDIIGVTLQTEFHFTNVVNILSLTNIPLRAAERERNHPFVMGGGPCAFNPEPLAPFFDCFIIGDAEELFPKIVEEIHRLKKGGTSRKEMLASIAHHPGVYVPQFIQPRFDHRGKLHTFDYSLNTGPIRKCVLSNISENQQEVFDRIPYAGAVHNRITVEAARGCPHNCRFCQAQIVYRPYRERTPQALLQQLTTQITQSGHEELSLTSLSIADYTPLQFLLGRLETLCTPRFISLSLPSLRVDSMSAFLDKSTQGVRNTGLTLAPEAGTERLRRVLNKQLDEETIFNTVELVNRGRVKTLKLYFMIGLPTETEEDLHGMIELILRIRKKLQRKNRRNVALKVSISPFVPKAHTPFQWASQNTMQELKEKCRFLKGKLPRKNITVHYHDPAGALIEGLFARGGREKADVLEQMVQEGESFTAWSDYFHFPVWEQILGAELKRIEAELNRERTFSEAFPWDFINTGISKKTLWKEYQLALRAKESPSCLEKDCDYCSQCEYSMPRQSDVENITVENNETVEFSKRSTLPPPYTGNIFRYRLHFSKRFNLRLLSHRELVTIISQAFRRAELPLAFSRGYNPHPKLSFGDALPVGIASEHELLDLELRDFVPPDDLIQRVNTTLPKGVTIIQITQIPRSLPTIETSIKVSTYHTHASAQLLLNNRLLDGEDWSDLFNADVAQLQNQIDDFLRRDTMLFKRLKKGKMKSVDLRPYLKSFSVIKHSREEVIWEMSIKHLPGMRARPNHYFQLFFEEKPLGIKLLITTKKRVSLT